VRKIALKIAEEIRSQYNISYARTKTGNPQIKMEAHAASHKDLMVRVNASHLPDLARPQTPSGETK
jgi:hypothetical protein